MKTLADFKRAMRVGVIFDCEHHSRPELSGPRRVTKVQTNAIRFEFTHPTEGVQVGWWYYGPVSRLRVAGDSLTVLDRPGGTAMFTYRLRREVST